jgi:broad specificity phosphatase PhoE
MLIIIRHSERLDEVCSKSEWKNHILYQINEIKSKRKHESISNDPPITDNGILIAKQAGKTLRTLLPSLKTDFPDDIKIRLYSSRLLRCVQTTIAIAKMLGITSLYISSGLALAAAAVDRLRDEFDFLSIEEIQQLAGSEFTIYDCDSSSLSTTSEKMENLFSVSKLGWFEALKDVSNHCSIDLKLVIAHRETIRNILPIFPRLPYCAIAVCHYNQTSLEADDTHHPHYHQKNYFQISKIFDCNGKVLHEFSPHSHSHSLSDK